LTIKSTSHTKPAPGLLRPRYSGSDLDQHAAHERYFFALHTCVYSMPVNIQLSKIDWISRIQESGVKKSQCDPHSVS